VDTEYGRKTQIHQASCNKDFSCLEGDCPSFVTVVPGRKAKHEVPLLDARLPEPAIPDEAPPAELQSEDVVQGDGAAAKAGDQVTVQYVGVDYETGEEFDSSWEGGQRFEFELGAGEVIPGWDQGVEGMKEGGRRQLIIPPDLAYGAQGQPPAIAPDATLVFVIDLVKVN
jgi:peptidylprolyl isomerase